MAALPYRPVSPILNSINSRVQDMLCADGKIHRIVPKIEATCHLIAIDSPNCIWFRLVNHIARDLQHTLSTNKGGTSKLEKLDTKKPLQRYDYVMAPLEEGVYARARILAVQQPFDNLQFVFVHFIDEGIGAWMLSGCLAKMDSQFRWHPWQAFPVSLFKLEIGKDYKDGTGGEGWPDSVKHDLVRIMGDYSTFRLIPARDKFRNNYSEYLRAEIYGLLDSENDHEEGEEAKSGVKVHLLLRGKKKGGDQEEGESIAHRLAIESGPFELIDRKMFNAKQQPLNSPEEVPRLSNQEEAKSILLAMPKWRQILPNEPCAPVPSNGMDPVWNGEIGAPQVPPVSVEWLKAHCAESINGRRVLMLCLDWNSLKSPFEFYAFPLRQTTNGNPLPQNPLRRLHILQTEQATQLNQFYGSPDNRKQLQPRVIIEKLMKGEHPFAIYETNDEICGSNFRRVQIIAAKEMKALNNEFCRIRFLDVAGSEVVPIAALLRIHPRHCSQTQLCIQLCLKNIQPVDDTTIWNKDECKFFKSQIRVDIPAKCGDLGPMDNQNNTPVYYYSSAHRWPGVFAASNLYVPDEPLEHKMVNQEKAKWASAINGRTDHLTDCF